MRLDWLALAWLAGITFTQQQAQLASEPVLLLLLLIVVNFAVCGLALAARSTRRPPGHSTTPMAYGLLMLLAAALAGLVWSQTLAHLRDPLILPEHLENTESDLVFDIVGIPVESRTVMGHSVRVVVRVVQGQPSPWPHGWFAQDVLLRWPGACVGHCDVAVEPGQRWQARVRWRSTQGELNAAGLDGQARQLQKGIHATAQIRGPVRQIGHADPWSLRVLLAQWRHRIARRLFEAMPDKPYAGVLVALSIGEQQGISADQWAWFSRAGVSHLVAISGTHVCLLAAMAGSLACLLMRRRLSGRRLSADGWVKCSGQAVVFRVVFGGAATLSALFYCLMAGWGIPAQRAFYTLAACTLGLSGRIPLASRDCLALALIIVTALDPWSVLTSGLWLSFGAVAALMLFANRSSTAYLSHTKPQDGSRARLTVSARDGAVLSRNISCERRAGLIKCTWQTLVCISHQPITVHVWNMLRLQLTVTLATWPVLAHQFNVISLVSLPANLWAVPWVSLVVTPCALLLALLACLPVPDAWLAIVAWPVDRLADLALWPAQWLAATSHAVHEVAQTPLWLFALSLSGVLLALAGPRLAYHWLGWLLMVPQMLWMPDRPVEGGWHLTAFDIGQGSAILIQTAQHQVLFDTGWRQGDSDAVKRMVLPALRALGVRDIDDVIVSHPDLDHMGGLATVLTTRDVRHVRGSGLVPFAYRSCRAGQQWSYDGVTFRFVAPQDDCASRSLSGVERNRCSCVLLVKGAWHSAVLPGDIDSTVERRLLGLPVSETLKSVPRQRPLRSRSRARTRRQQHNHHVSQPDVSHPDWLPVDVALMAHHGSASSSSLAWVKAMQARHAIAQAGRHNPFGHPDATVMQRWCDHGTEVWSSVWHGSVRVVSGPDGIEVQSARKQRRRYWHADVQPGCDLARHMKAPRKHRSRESRQASPKMNVR